MKILLIHFSSCFGGVEKHCLDIYQTLHGESLEVHLVTPPNGYDYGIEKERIHFLQDDQFKNFRNSQRLYRIIREVKPDLIHCHLYPASRFFFPVWLMTKIPVVETLHIEENWRVGWRKAFNLLDRFIGGLMVKKYIAVSKAVKNTAVRSKGIPSSKIDVVYNSVMEQNPKTVTPSKKGIRFGFLGRYEEHKGIRTLLATLSELENVPNWHFVFAGKGELECEINEFTKSHSQVENIGFQKDVSHFFDQIDCLILPSYFEGFPLVLLEAGYQGKSVVASEVSGIPELISHKINGLLVEKRSVASLQSAMTEMIRDPWSHQKYAEEHQKKVMEKFHFEQWKNKTRNFYLEAL